MCSSLRSMAAIDTAERDRPMVEKVVVKIKEAVQNLAWGIVLLAKERTQTPAAVQTPMGKQTLFSMRVVLLAKTGCAGTVIAAHEKLARGSGISLGTTLTSRPVKQKEKKKPMKRPTLTKKQKQGKVPRQVPKVAQKVGSNSGLTSMRTTRVMSMPGGTELRS